MKLSIVTLYPESYESLKLRAAAEARSLTALAGDFDVAVDLKSQTDFFTDFVVWRTSRLPTSQMASLYEFMKNSKVLNKAVIQNRALRSKDYQQRLVQDQTSVPTIPTYIFESVTELIQAVDSGDLVFPFIVKPRSAGKGMGVRLVSSLQDLDSVDYLKVLFQPFIHNNGDYRVLMLGGKMLGAMRRIAASGSILNNVSQGGTAVAVKDPILLERLYAYGLEIALATGLDFFGLDIIEEQQSGNLRFMEINVAPEWAGFEKVHTVSVADEVLDWLIDEQNGIIR